MSYKKYEFKLEIYAIIETHHRAFSGTKKDMTENYFNMDG